jgi:hypothetical protein
MAAERPVHSSAADHPAGNADTEEWFAGQLEHCPVVAVLISELQSPDSPRSSGEDIGHIDMLAESAEEMPPIIVHGPSMRIIDGMHRVRAAISQGRHKIWARIYDGDEENAFVIAVKTNVAHGLPLPRADRVAAAERIAGSHPQWSNQMIAAAAGLPASTVRDIRRRSTRRTDQSNTRLGQDGRVRPLDATEGRNLAGKLLAENPAASVRAIARMAGLAPSTVQDVRRRMRAGEKPSLSPKKPRRPERPHEQERDGAAGGQIPRQRAGGSRRPLSVAGLADTLDGLKKDPTLRLTDSGRSLLRWLGTQVGRMEKWEKVVETIPDHCVGPVARIARFQEAAWQMFAAKLEQRQNRCIS